MDVWVERILLLVNVFDIEQTHGHNEKEDANRNKVTQRVNKLASTATLQSIHCRHLGVPSTKCYVNISHLKQRTTTNKD